MMGKAKVPALPTVGASPYRRLWNILFWFDLPSRSAGSPVDVEVPFGEPADRAVSAASPICPSQAVSEARPPLAVLRSEHSPMRYLALGTPSDCKAFITAIRAFALAGKLGDSLTLIGYGRHRRRLEKWSTALHIDAIVTFAGPDYGPILDPAGYDSVILLSPCDERQVSVVVEIFVKGLRVISMSQEPDVVSFIRDRALGASIGSADALALGHAMLKAKYANCTH